MKQIEIVLAFLFCHLLCGAQATSLTIDNQTPGWLSSKLNYGDQQAVERLVISGYVNSEDLSFIGSLMQRQNLNGLVDLSDAYIVGDSEINDNDISYDNIFGLEKNVEIRKIALPKLINTPIPKSNVTPLKFITVDSLVYGSENCVIYNNALWGYEYAGGSGAKSSPKHLILREGVTSIAAYACDNHKYNSYGGNVKIETVTCPSTLRNIEERAFRECDLLHSINLPENVKEIQEWAFEKSSFIPDTLKLPRSLEVYYTNSFPIKDGQLIELGENVTIFDNHSWVLNKNIKAVFVIEREIPPTFIKGAKEGTMSGSYSDGTELSGCILYVPEVGYKYYSDPKYDSVGGASGQWSGWSNPYSHASIKTIRRSVTGISLNQVAIELTEGESERLVARILPDNATNTSIRWKSSDVSVAMVSDDGTVYAIKPGIATIMATTVDGGFVALCKVIVHPIAASGIKLNVREITMSVGQTDKLTATITPENASDKTITWKSDDESIATVTADGTVTAVSVGVANITASCGEVTATCKINVNPIVASGLVLNVQEITMSVGQTDKLRATVTPSNTTDKTVKWNSDDEDVVIVANDGAVTAVSVGVANITAACGDLKAVCKVTVEESSAINDVLVDPDERADVFSIMGIRMLTGVRRSEMSVLPTGIYIIRSASGKVQKVMIN